MCQWVCIFYLNSILVANLLLLRHPLKEVQTAHILLLLLSPLSVWTYTRGTSSGWAGSDGT